MCRQDRLPLVQAEFLKEGEYRNLYVEEWALSNDEWYQISQYTRDFQALFSIAENHAPLCSNNECVVTNCYLIKEELKNTELQYNEYVHEHRLTNNNVRDYTFGSMKRFIHFLIEDRINKYSDLQLCMSGVSWRLWYRSDVVLRYMHESLNN